MSETEKSNEAEGEQPSVSLLYQHGPCLVVDKPGGVLTQAPPHLDSMERRVREWLRHQREDGRNPYVGMVHRLDRPASGALLVGLHQRAARRLAEQFEGRIVDKRYWAVVEGRLPRPADQWVDWLRKRPGEAHVDIVPAGTKGAREARLRYRVLAATDDYSWIEVALETGRTHQIRVQAASRGHPILGDEQYGSRWRFGPQHEDRRLRWIALHARHLTFRHPTTREKVSVTSPVPTPWHTLGTPTGGTLHP